MRGRCGNQRYQRKAYPAKTQIWKRFEIYQTKKLDFKVIDRQEMEKSQLVSKQSQPALNKTDPMEILPYPDIFRPIIMSLDFPSILECTKVNKFWRRMLTKYDQLILPEKFDSTLNGMKKSGSQRNCILHFTK